MQSIPTVQRPSPVKRYSGTVELPVYLTAPEVLAWSAITAKYDELIKSAAGKELDLEAALAINKTWEEGICSIVRCWAIKDLPDHLTAAQFPSTPQRAASALRNWLIEEITQLYFIENDVPNE